MSTALLQAPEATIYIPLFEAVDCCQTKTLSPATQDIPSIVCVLDNVISVVVAARQGIFTELPLICEYVPNLVIIFIYSLDIFI